MKHFAKIGSYLFSNRIKLTFLILLTGLFVIQSCEQNSINETNDGNILSAPSENGKFNSSVNSDNEYLTEMDFGDYKFSYSTQSLSTTLKNLRKSGAGNAIQSTFQIKKGNSIVYFAEYELDTTIAHYRLLQHKKIERIAKSLDNNLAERDYDYVIAGMNMYIKEIRKSASFNELNQQSIFFHKAIVNAKKREK